MFKRGKPLKTPNYMHIRKQSTSEGIRKRLFTNRTVPGELPKYPVAYSGGRGPVAATLGDATVCTSHPTNVRVASVSTITVPELLCRLMGSSCGHMIVTWVPPDTNKGGLFA